MTAPVLDLSAVSVGALLGGLTEWVGHPRPKCATCGQFTGHLLGRMPGHVYGSNWKWVPCQSCGGDGLASVQSGPHTWRARVNDEPVRVGNIDPAVPRHMDHYGWRVESAEDGDLGLTNYSDPTGPQDFWQTLPAPGSLFDIEGEALPIYEADWLSDHGLPVKWQEHVEIYDEKLTHCIPGPEDTWVKGSNLSSSLPFGSWRPGVDMALHVTKIEAAS